MQELLLEILSLGHFRELYSAPSRELETLCTWPC
ncbi:hypothetical protein SAMN05660912_00634 [Pseudomonas sp. LAMO17WK12:I1]|jgi:hypothetical protein|nr:hypothetical protein SAMN05660912_00634 [Pseudomonas sp. LAMO17WK12:I1]